MSTFTRVVIVRRGETTLFQALCERYAGDPDTVVLYDRRGSAVGDGHGDAERRWPQQGGILDARGFYVIVRVPATLNGLSSS